MHKRSAQLANWDPTVVGQVVRLRDNPGRIGRITGLTRESGSFTLVQVEFGPAERPYKRVETLEPVDSHESTLDLLVAGKLGGPADLRRALTFEKIKGGLTNVLYSMEATRADFHAHQFKPVLRFIESSSGRILLADEVGLGKTVEAMYIWKELQARISARRVLVVCPAMLREKWRRDMLNLFNIHADLDNADTLLRKARTTVIRDPYYAFASIVGLEAVRPPKGYIDPDKRGPRAELARLLDENPTSEDFALFDLVIVDEAHNLRNPSTASNRLGRLLRDSSRHVVLLTATPIQVSDDNLLELLRLIDEDRFQNRFIFRDLLEANAPILRLARSIWKIPPNLGIIRNEVLQARGNRFFQNHAVLRRIEDRIEAAIEISPSQSDTSISGEPFVTLLPEDQVELARMAESCSLLGQYITRTRKREILTNRVIRSPQALFIQFSEPERRIYDHVSAQIRLALRDLSGSPSGWQFSLIMRQRQMASSLPAALGAWEQSPELSELLWEDLGATSLFDLDGELEEDLDEEITGDADGDVLDARKVGVPTYDLAQIESCDQKYHSLLQFLLASTEGTSDREKTIVFAFFRNTLQYLHRRLTEDGIDSMLLMGGMPDAQEVLDRFADPRGPTVLLSSEVGSEGLDLQFCRRLVNYDLPWNPMRVEQRIGRLDRLGQLAERISIVNLVVENTIEDRILYRLYDRIHLFQESIGDLEAILGDRTDRLLFDLVNPCLSEAERQTKADQAALAIENRKAEQERLEREAANLFGLSDYVSLRIQETRDQHRWLGPDDFWSYVTDFFDLEYPGTVIQPLDSPSPPGTNGEIESTNSSPTCANISLSAEARYSMSDFVQESPIPVRSVIHEAHRPVQVFFDARHVKRVPIGSEVIDLSHPLIRWIQRSHALRPRAIHPVSAITVRCPAANLPIGDFVFVIHRWMFSGLRQEQTLEYRVCNVDSCQLLSSSESEKMVEVASRSGTSIPNASGIVAEFEHLRACAELCEHDLAARYGDRLADFVAENQARCDQFETGVRAFADRRVADLEDRIQRLRMQGKLRTIPAFEGQIQKALDDREARLRKIDRKHAVDDEMTELLAGIIQVKP
jgi:Superfamily II DNA/RNA helicases, SNF2 family